MKKHLLIIVAVLATLGCAGSSTNKEFSAVGQMAPEAKLGVVGGGQDKGADAAAKPVSRKIIYTANVELVVVEFEAAQKALGELVEKHKGYVAKSEVRGAPGSRRTGTWTLRVPEADFTAFLAGLDRLGEPQRNTIDSKDVTEEFYDLEARIKNKKVEEERLITHLKESTGKLEDILAVERELSRVRGEIEQAQGRLQKLSNLTELTTVTVTVQELKDYVPPAAPSFGTSLGRTFEGSWTALVTLGKFIVLVAVALVPWLPVLGIIGGAIWLLVRRYQPQSPRRGRPPVADGTLPVEPA